MSMDLQAVNGNREAKVVHSTFKMLGKYTEFFAVGFSGLLVLAAWLMGSYGMERLSVFAYILAFAIGGFAKAKEGLQDTIEHKQLNVEMLMLLAAVGSAAIGYWMEGAILIFIFALSGALETYTMNKSRKEIHALMQMQPEEAWLITENTQKKVHVSALQVGDLILVKPGERIATDGQILEGVSTIDESPITGESIPVCKSSGEEVFAGTINVDGSLRVQMTKPNHETLFAKMIELVQSAQSQRSTSQLFIEKFEGTYVRIVLAMVFLMMIIPYLAFGWSWMESFYRAMVLLVVASPCALVASIMPATLAAISYGAKKGILFKGGGRLEELAHLQAIAFDKTGTLTEGKPKVADFLVMQAFKEEEVMDAVASIEQYFNHPVAKAIVSHVIDQAGAPSLRAADIQDVAGWGVKATIDGAEWRVGKRGFMQCSPENNMADKAPAAFQAEGKTTVFVERNGKLAAMISLKDRMRDETAEALAALQRQGIHTVMLTGDNERTAEAIAAESGIDEFKSECLPETKVSLIKDLQRKHRNVAMVGDGINDAPALAAANVGIAIGDGTDAALETADMILMKSDLKRIPEALKLSKKMNRIIKQNIIFSVGMIILLMMSNFLQLVNLPLGVIGHEGSTLLVILNGLRLLKQ